MTKNANYFKRFGNAAELAYVLSTIEDGLNNASDELHKSLIAVGETLFENCSWRKAFDDEAARTWVGTMVFNLVQTAVERGFKYFTLDKILCEPWVVRFLALLDELNITEFVFADYSTACMENLIAFTNNGWRVAGTKEQTYYRHGEPRTVAGLRIVKAKKN